MPALLAAEVLADPWRWQPHPEIWALVVGLGGLYWYALTRIGPTATRPGEAIVTRAQVGWFAGALLLLWLATDWPVHDLAEEYLYSVHMVQHLLLSLVVPAMVLLATPTWLARMVIGRGRAYRVLRRVTRPIPATLLFNGVVVLTHWPLVVNASASNGVLHYGVHVLVVASALVMWLPVCGPLPELRISLPAQMGYLFLQSIIPTVPAGWLTFAERAVYDAYEVLPRVWGLSVTWDQQLAGLVMKVVGGFFLWTIIAVLFFRWSAINGGDHATGMALDRRAPAPPAPDAPLTWDEVERELAAAGPAPKEPPA